MTPQEELENLLQQEGWTPQFLLDRVRAWNLPRGQAIERLRSGVTPTITTDNLARLWFALQELGATPNRSEFFPQCERPAPPAALLSWASIPGGNFLMGSGEDTSDSCELPRHRVSIEPFQMAKTVVTREQYRVFDPRRSYVGASSAPANMDALAAADEISWYEASLFCRWLGGRLPSEAEWEYACRAGTSGAYWSGDSEADLARVGWYSANTDCELQPIAQKPANPFGLHDMHGNLWEWCADSWHDDYDGAPTDGSAWVDERYPARVVRGGCFWSRADGCRSAFRSWSQPSSRETGDGGFRVVRPADAS